MMKLFYFVLSIWITADNSSIIEEPSTTVSTVSADDRTVTVTPTTTSSTTSNFITDETGQNITATDDTATVSTDKDDPVLSGFNNCSFHYWRASWQKAVRVCEHEDKQLLCYKSKQEIDDIIEDFRLAANGNAELEIWLSSKNCSEPLQVKECLSLLINKSTGNEWHFFQEDCEIRLPFVCCAKDSGDSSIIEEPSKTVSTVSTNDKTVTVTPTKTPSSTSKFITDETGQNTTATDDTATVSTDKDDPVLPKFNDCSFKYWRTSWQRAVLMCEHEDKQLLCYKSKQEIDDIIDAFRLGVYGKTELEIWLSSKNCSEPLQVKECLSLHINKSTGKVWHFFQEDCHEHLPFVCCAKDSGNRTNRNSD